MSEVLLLRWLVYVLTLGNIYFAVVVRGFQDDNPPHVDGAVSHNDPVFKHPQRGAVPFTLHAKNGLSCGGEPQIMGNGSINPKCFEHRKKHNNAAPLPEKAVRAAATGDYPPQQIPTDDDSVPTGVVVAASFGGLAAIASAGGVGYYTWSQRSGKSADSEAMLNKHSTQLKSLSTGYISDTESQAESEKFEVDGDITFWSKQADFAAF